MAETLLLEQALTSGTYTTTGQLGVVLAQGISGVTALLSSVSLSLAKYGSPTDNIYVTINQGSLNGTLLATSSVIPLASIPAYPGAWINFPFATPVSLAAGTTYYIQVCRSALDATNVLGVNYQSPEVYAGGITYDAAGNAFVNVDLTFRLYETTGAPSYPDPITTEWVPIWHPQGSGPVGATGPPGIQGLEGPEGPEGPQGPPGVIANHAPTHNTGGADPVTALSGGVITTGTVADARLSPNVPLLDAQNVFTGGILTLIGPPPADVASRIAFFDSSQPSGAEEYQFVNGGQLLRILALDNSPGAIQAEWKFERTGVIVSRKLTLIGPGYPQIRIEDTIPLISLKENPASADKKIWRMYASAESLYIDGLNDAESAQNVSPFRIDRLGGVYLPGTTVPIGQWNSVPIGNLSFSTNAGVWTVPSIAYFKYAVVNKIVFLKCAITGTTVVNSGSELRVLLTGIPLTLGGNDSFGFTVYTQDGFTTQDTGQSICRVANNSLVFKTRTGAAWTAAGAVTGVIANLVGELA